MIRALAATVVIGTILGGVMTPSPVQAGGATAFGLMNVSEGSARNHNDQVTPQSYTSHANKPVIKGNVPGSGQR